MAAPKLSRVRVLIPPTNAGKVLGALMVLCALVAVAALGILAVRSATRLSLRWDEWAYHIPIAAIRGGLPIPYDMNDVLSRYQAFPPLPELVQGVLWRLNGSVNATGVVNFMAFVIFLGYCHVALRARIWLVALVSLTAPLVLIHSTVSYVDLFGNSFLAIGASSVLYLYLFPDRSSRLILVGGLMGLVAAAWSKYQLAPVAVVLFILFTLVTLRLPRTAPFSRPQLATLVVTAAALATIPFVENLALHGNPFWPIRIPLPVLGDLFPYAVDTAQGAAANRPPTLAGVSQFEVFFRSLFEIDVPTEYPNRARWIIDQGSTNAGLRMGGFWVGAVVVYLATTITLLVLRDRKHGLIAAAAIGLMLCFVALIPQSHELRYFLFIPLTLAATIGMLFSALVDQRPRVCAAVLVIVLALFSHMAAVNSTYYELERIDYATAARLSGAPRWWAMLRSGETYCAVDIGAVAIMLTGPTMSEYTIVDRSSEALCPAGSLILTPAGLKGRAP